MKGLGSELYNSQIETLTERVKELEGAAKALIGDVRNRYPGEELRCPHMIALDAALKDA